MPKKSITTPGLHLISFADTECTEVPYLFYPYLARGEITILSADPGSGKSYFAAWLAACVSRGSFPVNQEKNQPSIGCVLFLSKEDQYSHTIVPRFMANDGMGEKVFYLPMDEMPKTFVDPVIDSILFYKPELLIFDTVSSFAGNINMNQANEVRQLLYPLAAGIEGSNTAVLLIAHNNKSSGTSSAQYRLSGSVDFAAIARSCLTIGKNPDRKNSFIMAQYKNNLGPIGNSLCFDLKDTGGLVPGLEFAGFSELGADELLSKSAAPKRSTLVQEVSDLIVKILQEGGGRKEAREVIGELKKMGFSESTIQRARTQLGIHHTTNWDCRLKHNVSYWKLPL